MSLPGPDPFRIAAELLQPRGRRWERDPVLWCEECVEWPEGRSLYPYQARALQDLTEGHRAALRAMHGVGKTGVDALLVLWFCLTRDAMGQSWRCLTTAGSWHQLERYLWPEIHLWARRLRWDVIGRPPFDEQRELLSLQLKLEHGQAFAGSSDDPRLLEGLHGEQVLVLLDEAKSIVIGTWDALEGAMSQGEAYAFASSTPAEPVGRFYAICARQPGTDDWRVSHVTLEEALSAGAIRPEWVEQRRLQWGEQSALFRTRVLGEFATSDEDGVIPLAWLEQAVERWREWDAIGRPDPGGRLIVGVDVARFGRDQTVLCSRQGDVVLRLERHSMRDTMEVVGLIRRSLTQPFALAVVDSIGIGAGVLDRLWEERVAATGFNASERSVRRDQTGSFGFVNRRAEAWWRLREMLDPAASPALCIPDDAGLLGDLCSPKWKLTSAGKVQIESKDEIRKRLGRSPDSGDALVQSLVVSGQTGPAVQQGAVRWRDGQQLDPQGLRTAVKWTGQREVVRQSWR